MTPEEVFDQFLSLLPDSKPATNGWFQAFCPAHNDQKKRTLHLTKGDFKVILNCKAGCTEENILLSMGKEKRDIVFKQEKPKERKKHLVKTWTYTDTSGAVLYEKERWDYDDKSGKEMMYKSHGKYGMNGNKPTLYNLAARPAALANPDFVATVIVEGEKCVDALQALLGPTFWVTTSGGAGSWRDEFSEIIKNDKDVIAVPDNDEPGEGYINSIKLSMSKTVPAKEPVVVRIPGLREKQDVYDWIAYGGSREDFLRLADEAIDYLDPKYKIYRDDEDYFQLYEEYICECTDAPRIFAKFMAFSAAASVLRNHVWYEHGLNDITPNLWILLVAGSSFFRKSTNLTGMKDLILSIDKDLLLPDEFSKEGLLKHLVEHPQGIMIHQEFGKFYDLIRREYNSGAEKMLTELYDCPKEYTKILTKETITIQEPVINIACASTISWLNAVIKSKDIFGGFMSRFIIVPASKKEKSMARPPKPDQKKRQRIIDKLKRAAELRGEITLSNGAGTSYDQWFERYEQKYMDNPWSASFVRLQSTCLKFSFVSEIMSTYKLLISEESMDVAKGYTNSITRYMDEFMKDEVSFSPIEERTKAVIKALKSSGGKSTRSKLLKNSHVGARDFAEVITTLEQRGEITTEKIPTPNGRELMEISLT